MTLVAAGSLVVVVVVVYPSTDHNSSLFIPSHCLL